MAVANGSFSYQPPLLLQQMESDLATLPMFFGDSEDIIITDRKPSTKFLDTLNSIGFEIPSFHSLSEAESFPDNSMDIIYPWGWSPSAHFILKNLKGKCDQKFTVQPNSQWTDTHRRLYERSTALQFLQELLENNRTNKFVELNQTGQIVYSVSEIENLLTTNNPLVLKAPMSSSGRGVQIIRKLLLNASNKQWLAGILKQQNYLIAEPFIDKISDLSFQFRINSEQDIDFLGISIFETNSNGQYQGTILNPSFSNFFPGREHELKELCDLTSQQLLYALKNSIYAKLHRGFLGIDAMIFEKNGSLKIQPCVEVNCRMNMGILALQIQNKIHPEASGKFELIYDKNGILPVYKQKTKEKQNPGFQDGKLCEGFLPLTEANETSKFGAYISLGTAK